MSIRVEMLEWLENDEELKFWAYQYLITKALRKPEEVCFKGEVGVLEWAEQLQCTPGNTRLLIGMKTAWSMQVRRKNKLSKKPCTFELDTEVKTQLNYLAKRQGKTIIATLEDLIKRAAKSSKKSDAKAAKPKASLGTMGEFQAAIAQERRTSRPQGDLAASRPNQRASKTTDTEAAETGASLGTMGEFFGSSQNLGQT